MSVRETRYDWAGLHKVFAAMYAMGLLFAVVAVISSLVRCWQPMEGSGLLRNYYGPIVTGGFLVYACFKKLDDEISSYRGRLLKAETGNRGEHVITPRARRVLVGCALASAVIIIGYVTVLGFIGVNLVHVSWGSLVVSVMMLGCAALVSEQVDLGTTQEGNSE